MPDTRRHRGPAPADTRLFGEAALADLRKAVAELSFLLGRDYSEEAALKLVGDRYALTARQRKAVMRCACSDATAAARRKRQRRLEELRHADLHVDAFNCIILCESLLASAPVLRGRDGALRDLASVHGTWRRVSETSVAIQALSRVLQDAQPRSVAFWLDRPVSNSGRLAALLREAAPAECLLWTVELIDRVDPHLTQQPGVIASADSWVLDRCQAWVDLPAEVSAQAANAAWIIDLAG